MSLTHKGKFKQTMTYFKIIGLLTVILFIASCNPTNKDAMTSSDTPKKEHKPSLQDSLNARKAAWEVKASDEKKKLYAEGIADVANSGLLQNAKQVGNQAPEFTLQNALGENVSLADYLKKGPVVLTWYRGGWCPYCNITLHRLQEELPNFQAAGANLLALTPEVPDKSLSTKEKHDLQFEVLSDVGNAVAHEYGIVFKLIPELADSYQSGFGLHEYNGDETDELPIAATYIIDQQGVIQYAFLDPDYRNRAEPADIIKALEAL